MAAQYTTIDEYLSLFDPATREKLSSLRACIHAAAPDAAEKISWQMPTFFLNGNLVHFAAFKKHVGFYPGESGVRNFEDRFKAMGLKYSKGAVQFPLTQPLPLALVDEITRFRVEENTSKR